jgi:type I restriction enzyme S subunit
MTEEWVMKPFESCIKPVVYSQKIQRKDFLLTGQYPIVSQEAEYTNGYWDNEADVFRVSRPVVLFGDHTQILKYVDFDFVLGADGVKILQPHGFLNPKFFYYQLQAVEFPTLGYARHYRLLKEIEIRVPSLPEQQRIVALLDEAFAGLATVQANAERNLQNARTLFDSYLEAVFGRRDEGWVEHALGDLIEIQNGYAFKSGEYTDSGYFVIRIGNVQDGEITLNNPRYIRLMDQRLERFILEEGDILISLTGNIGRVGMIRGDQLPAVLNQRVARIQLKDKSVDRDFLFRFLSLRTFREGLQESGHGAAQQNVSTKEIESVRLLVPSMDQQLATVHEFNTFAEEWNRLTRIYERKLTALNELKKSLLQQAFYGDL